jgi:hypothetical protein
MKKYKILILALTSLLLASAIMTAQATTVSVKIGDNANGGYILQSGGVYVGNFPITVNGQPTLAYCMNMHGTVNFGATYQAELTNNLYDGADASKWKSIAYILTWHDPHTNEEGAANAIAIWKILDPGVDLGSIEATYINEANTLITEATSPQKDVVRQNDKFEWISPKSGTDITVNANPGETITFTVKLTDSANTPRSGVRILFLAVLESGSGSPINLSPISAHTNNEGIASVTVTVPLNAQPGSSIKVTANTKGTYPNLYLDLRSSNNNLQNLIGLDTTFDLTLSTEVNINAHIFVLPEGPLGALTAVGACGLAFVAWTKHSKRSRKPT